MTNYNGEKGKRLRGSMAPKSDDEVALAGQILAKQKKNKKHYLVQTPAKKKK